MAVKGAQDARYRAAIDALREVRLAAGMTQEELAAKLGRSQQFVSKYESFERRLDVVEFIDISKALVIDWHGLLHRVTR